MFDTLLGQFMDAGRPLQHICRVDCMPGTRVYDVDCLFPKKELPIVSGARFLEIIFCRKGTVQIAMKSGGRVELQEHEVLLLSGEAEVDTIRIDGRYLKAIVIHIDCADAKDSFLQISDLFGGLRLDLSGESTFLKDKMGCAVVTGSYWNGLLFDGLEKLTSTQRGQQCMMMTIQLLHLLQCDSRFLPCKSAAEYYDHYQIDSVRQAHDYMRLHLGERLTIHQLARRFHISSTLLKECFRQLYGQPIHKSLQKYRMQRAAELLATTSTPILQIAIAVGYGSASQFGVMFKRHYSDTPSRYRRLKRKMSKTVPLCPNQIETSQ